MAKYTETFAEYVANGGVLPSASFALIPDFEDLFKERFCGSEIGFETETLFAIKLDLKARVIMPEYAARVAAIDKAMLKLEDPVKQRTEKREYGKMHSETENDGSNTDLPFDADTATPSLTTHAEGSADTDAHTDDLTYTDYVTIDENLRIIEQLDSDRKGIIERCLEEFKPLFMGVY